MTRAERTQASEPGQFSMRHYEGRFLTVQQVTQRLQRALAGRQPFSLVRLGSGEAMALAHGILLPLNQFPFPLDYSGVTLPSEKLRHDLLVAIRQADVVGLVANRAYFHCAPLLEACLDHFHVRLPQVCDATINWHLHRGGRGPLYPLLGSRRVAIVGRKAEEAVPHLTAMGLLVAGHTALEGYDDLERAFQVLKTMNFDVALVAAGIPAVILCPRVARYLGKVAIDFGHCINDIITPGFGEAELASEKARWRASRPRSPGPPEGDGAARASR